MLGLWHGRRLGGSGVTVVVGVLWRGRAPDREWWAQVRALACASVWARERACRVVGGRGELAPAPAHARQGVRSRLCAYPHAPVSAPARARVCACLRLPPSKQPLSRPPPRVLVS
eukprot:5356699-Pleurochrysis_carterae.AAC.1